MIGAVRPALGTALACRMNRSGMQYTCQLGGNKGGGAGGAGTSLLALDRSGITMNFLRIRGSSALAARSVTYRFALRFLHSMLLICVNERNIENKLNFLQFLVSNILLCFLIVVNCPALSSIRILEYIS